jgi:hypothetical protein
VKKFHSTTFHPSTDLKKLIKYEDNPMRSTTEVKIQSGPANINIKRMFDSHPSNSRSKHQNNFHIQQSAQPAELEMNLNQTEHKPEKNKIHKHRPSAPVKDQSSNQVIVEQQQKRPESAETCHNRIFSADSHRISRQERQEMTKKSNAKKQQKPDENIPSTDKHPKGWIRPRSASQTTKKSKIVKKTDPVSLYQSYQKDWQKFRTNICESSHSDLRWSIRERMANKQ